jgi:hypothetical protein
MRRIAAVKVWWKVTEGHGVDESELTTMETLWPANLNSTLGWASLRDGSVCHDFSNAVLSTALLSSATNLCIEISSLITVLLGL